MENLNNLEFQNDELGTIFEAENENSNEISSNL